MQKTLEWLNRKLNRYICWRCEVLLIIKFWKFLSSTLKDLTEILLANSLKVVFFTVSCLSKVSRTVNKFDASKQSVITWIVWQNLQAFAEHARSNNHKDTNEIKSRLSRLKLALLFNIKREVFSLNRFICEWTFLKWTSKVISDFV